MRTHGSDYFENSRQATFVQQEYAIRNPGISSATAFNRTFAVPDSPTGWWVTPYHFGIDQGPVVLMIENYRTGLIWNIIRRCPAVVTGLRRAGFTGGWL
jgi:hypothetical protein